MYPNPNDISVQDIMVDTLLGYKTIRIGTAEFHAAASATPSRILKHKRSSPYEKQHQTVEGIRPFICVICIVIRNRYPFQYHTLKDRRAKVMQLCSQCILRMQMQSR